MKACDAYCMQLPHDMALSGSASRLIYVQQWPGGTRTGQCNGFAYACCAMSPCVKLHESTLQLPLVHESGLCFILPIVRVSGLCQAMHPGLLIMAPPKFI